MSKESGMDEVVAVAALTVGPWVAAIVAVLVSRSRGSRDLGAAAVAAVAGGGFAAAVVVAVLSLWASRPLDVSDPPRQVRELVAERIRDLVVGDAEPRQGVSGRGIGLGGLGGLRGQGAPNRADLPPEAPPARTRQAHPDRVRDNQFISRSRGLKTPNKTSQLNRQQSRQKATG